MDRNLGGVVLSYSKVKILTKKEDGTSVGTIVSLHPWVHFDCEVCFMLFAPQPGHHLVGTVSQLGADHISLLVHKIHTVTIDKSNLPDHLTYNYKDAVWANKDQEIKADSELRFRVLQVEDHGNVLSLRGSLKGDGLGLLNSVHEMSKLSAESLNSSSSVSSSKGSSKKVKSQKKSKKKDKSTKKLASSTPESVVSADGTASTASKKNTSEPAPKSAKKKRKLA
eukprot:CAMPEP_0175157996 /NCGR_PEP_ID=MMETSP0087-20121206/22551_1 /TAXON_ID=136419 /ORGANISM="Unknown Unknown, Strain D1" /LENGTH=223 /DNA_ID=CAMNT_0016445745 /DNA_START=51 /DNA_END=722 /DNA_ORIENTATION=+